MLEFLIALSGEGSVTVVNQDMRSLSIVGGVVVISTYIGIKSMGIEMLMFGEVEMIILIQEPGISMSSLFMMRVTKVDVMPNFVNVLMLQGFD